jgi:uncharacterized LabA/DUF88 family protein
MAQLPPADVALFIDWENLKYSLAKRGMSPNLPALLDFVAKEYGRVVVAYAYADWLDSPHLQGRDQNALYYAGIEPVYVPAKRRGSPELRRNDSIDLKLTADLVEVSYSHPHIERFVIVSGDADFLHVSASLRRRGKWIAMIGVTGATAQCLPRFTDAVAFYDEHVERPKTVKPQAAPPPVAEAPKKVVPAKETPPDPIPIYECVVAYVRQQRAQGNYPLLSSITPLIKKDYPSFVLRQYGFTKLLKFLQEAEAKKWLNIQTHGQHHFLMLPGDTMPPALAARGGQAETEAEVTRQVWLAERAPAIQRVVLTAREIEDDAEYPSKETDIIVARLKGQSFVDGQGKKLPPMSQANLRSLIGGAVSRGYLVRRAKWDAAKGQMLDLFGVNRDHPEVGQILRKTLP